VDLPPLPPPGALDALLPPDVDLATGVGLRHEAAVPVWYGVVWSRLGRGDLAWRHWDRVQLPELQPWIAAERGRVLRELGLHAGAETLEWPALLRAADPADAAMLRVSLTADAVGFGDRDRARRRHEAAREAVTALEDSPRAARQRLRLTWVGVEVAYLDGVAPSADGLPWWEEGAGRADDGGDGRGPVVDGTGGGPVVDGTSGGPAYPADHAWGSAFHSAKGLLFGGIVRRDPRLLDAAAALAPPVLAWGVHLARADAGVQGALAAAREAWRAMVHPPHVTDAVAATVTAQRLSR
jgi:hypothetical protein